MNFDIKQFDKFENEVQEIRIFYSDFLKALSKNDELYRLYVELKKKYKLNEIETLSVDEIWVSLNLNSEHTIVIRFYISLRIYLNTFDDSFKELCSRFYSEYSGFQFRRELFLFLVKKIESSKTEFNVKYKA